MTRDVVVVPHTHWDREWYEPFQTFRLRLVTVVDELLDLLDREPGFTHFMLDGQMAVVDDYLAVRPEQTERVCRLVAEGRLAIGPWYILMDEFLVSGETIVRDLQRGMDRAGEIGAPLPVGYLPDMFGHIAQMPQILRLAGFEHAVVWRGVPAAIDRSAFWWSAPDGSTVRAEYLPRGYGNGSRLTRDTGDLIARITRFDEDHGATLAGPVLWLNGTDHQAPQPWLATMVDEANRLQDRYRLRVGSLPDALAAGDVDGLPTWSGELRSGSRANLLMGVASNRTDVKQAVAAAQRWIERYAEPLCAVHLEPQQWPATLLDEAWLSMIRNAAHDSICACSHDEVCAAVLVRYDEARRIGEGLTTLATTHLAGRTGGSGPIAVNPSAHRRSGLVEVGGPGHEPAPGTQLVTRQGGTEVTDGITAGDAVVLVTAGLYERARVVSGEVSRDPDGVIEVRLHEDPAEPGGHDTGAVIAQVQAAAAPDPVAPARLAITTPATHRALVHVAEVPGFGWAAVEPSDVAHVSAGAGTGTGVAAVADNGLVRMTVAPDGTFSLRDGEREAHGLGRLVDDGDSGDTYNYNPPAGDVVVDVPEQVAVRVIEDGPLRARIAIDRRYRWPVAVEDDARVGAVDVDTTTVVELVAGSPVVRLSTELENPSRDHRLRAWFPLPSPAHRSVAECAFGIVERALVAEGGPSEPGLPTFPSQRFVCAGGLTVLHDGLPEYELVDLRDTGEGPAAHALALTLLRCTGLISRGPMPYRPLPAGPQTPTPAAQMPGRHVLRYAVVLGDDPLAAYAAADDAFVPLLTGQSPAHDGLSPLPRSGSALDVRGAQVSGVLRNAEGRLVVRLFNPTAAPATAQVAGRRGRRTDLRDRTLSGFDGTVTLSPWEIVTLVLDEP